MPSTQPSAAVGPMAPITRTYPATGERVSQIVADHHAMRRDVNGLLVLAEHGGALDRTLCETLVTRLGQLCERLGQHFALEEEGGYLHEVVAQRPGLQSRAATLQRQHATLLGEGAALSRLLLGARPPHETAARLVRLLEALRRHEIAEHDLFQQAFLDDLGSGD